MKIGCSIYDPATGKILRTVLCDPSDVANQARGSQGWVLGLYSDIEHVVIQGDENKATEVRRRPQAEIDAYYAERQAHAEKVSAAGSVTPEQVITEALKAKNIVITGADLAQAKTRLLDSEAEKIKGASHKADKSGL